MVDNDDGSEQSYLLPEVEFEEEDVLGDSFSKRPIDREIKVSDMTISIDAPNGSSISSSSLLNERASNPLLPSSPLSPCNPLLASPSPLSKDLNVADKGKLEIRIENGDVIRVENGDVCAPMVAKAYTHDNKSKSFGKKPSNDDKESLDYEEYDYGFKHSIADMAEAESSSIQHTSRSFHSNTISKRNPSMLQLAPQALTIHSVSALHQTHIEEGLNEIQVLRKLQINGHNIRVKVRNSCCFCVTRRGPAVAAMTRVIREGKEVDVLTRNLVKGDLVLISCNQVVPADMRIVSVDNLILDNALFYSGCSTQVVCEVQAQGLMCTETLEAVNMALCGAVCVSGTGKGIVTATGKKTEIARQLYSSSREKKEDQEQKTKSKS